MAKKKISAFTETTTLADGDILPVVINPATVPASRKITKANARKELFSAITDPVLIKSGDGINFDTAAGDDDDIDVLTLNVTGTPTLSWDESADAFAMSHGLQIAAGALTLGTAYPITAVGSNYCARSDVNTIDAGTTTNSILGGGSTNYINAIGSTGLPFGDPGSAPPDWEADSGYVDNAAIIATICGGYDHIVNQIAGVIVGGGHNFIKYHVQGHSTITGGGFNIISSGRSSIIAGSLNAITGDHIQGFIGVGVGGRVQGDYASILNGYLCHAYGDYSFAYGNQSHAEAAGAVAWADSQNAIFTVDTENMWGARYAGGFYLTGGQTHLATNLTAAGSATLKIDNHGTAGNEAAIEFRTSSTAGADNVRNGRLVVVNDGAQYSTSRMTLQNTGAGDALIDTLTLKGGSIGVLVVSPSFTLGFGGTAPRTIGIERNTTENTAGSKLTISGGDATSGATNKNGGALELKAGGATGSGYSTIAFFQAKQASPGTADNAASESMRITGAGNVSIGVTTWGTNGQKNITLGSGTAPSAPPADSAAIYVKDQAAGNACVHTKTENGGELKLFQGAAIADAGAGEAEAQLNLLLAHLRAMGIIAT